MEKTLLIILFVMAISILMADEVEREMVVLEIFTSTGCYYCPGAAMGAEDLIANGCDVAVIEYHSSDPFMNTYAVSRSSYYGVGGIPHAFFDGVLDVLGGSHSHSMYGHYLPRYNQRKDINSSFTINIDGSNSGLDYSVTVTVNKVAETSSTDMVLHLTLTESNIPYNWQGQTELHWVERLMVPDQYGTALDFSSDSTNTVNLSFTLDEDWVVDNCELVAFIQDTDTKEVLQGAKVSLPEITSPPGTIEGTVTLNGVSGNVEEVVVTADGVAASPDTAGYYIINITPGIYDVTASLTGYIDSTIVGVEVFADQVTNGIDFTLEVYNGPPDWEIISGTQYYMFLKGGITLEGVQFEGIGDNMAGAFCWTDSLECRGIATWQATGFWFFYIVSNVNNGEEITFKIYDSETDTIYNCNETIIFENGTTIGTSSNPYQLTASHYSTGGEYQLLSTKLNSNFPNPFNHSTTISFSLKEKGNVKLSVYNIKGQLVETLVDEEMNPGRDYKIIWDGKSGNKELANGIYLYKFETKNKTFIKKMILMK